MQLQGEAQRITIYIGESDRYHGRNLYQSILEYLRREGAAGATVTRALAGFGAHSRIHTANIEVLSSDLPIRIEWIDLPERVEKLLPQLRSMVKDGLIIREAVSVIYYSMGHEGDPLAQPVRNIMREEVTSVQGEAPVARVVALLIERGIRSLPVIDAQGRLSGIITDGDLLRRAGLSARLGVHDALPIDQVRADLEALRQSAALASDIMTLPVISVRDNETVSVAIERMVQHNLKRLPVVDESGRLVGMVSRIDVFRAVESQQGQQSSDAEAPQTGRTVAELMHTDVPTVGPDAALEEILQALEQNARRRVVVVDGQRHVLGIITDGDLLRRSRQRHHPGLIDRLRAVLNGQPSVTGPLPDAGERAADLMTAPVVTIHPDARLEDALHLMTERAIKRLPVVDDDGRLLGLLGRASLLRGLLEQDQAGPE